jgi:hypothetical protein
MRKGDLVEIRFWDHCMNGAPCECKVWGKVESAGRAHIELTTWELQTDDQKERDHNREFFSILRKVIISWTVLGRKK